MRQTAKRRQPRQKTTKTVSRVSYCPPMRLFLFFSRIRKTKSSPASPNFSKTLFHLPFLRLSAPIESACRRHTYASGNCFSFTVQVPARAAVPERIDSIALTPLRKAGRGGSVCFPKNQNMPRRIKSTSCSFTLPSRFRSACTGSKPSGVLPAT